MSFAFPQWNTDLAGLAGLGQTVNTLGSFLPGYVQGRNDAENANWRDRFAGIEHAFQTEAFPDRVRAYRANSFRTDLAAQNDVLNLGANATLMPYRLDATIDNFNTQKAINPYYEQMLKHLFEKGDYGNMAKVLGGMGLQAENRPYPVGRTEEQETLMALANPGRYYG